MLLAEDSSERAPSSPSRNACFTRRWQSSKVPRTASDLTLPPQQVSWRSWVGDTSPLGYSTATSTPGRSWKAAATAPPVSPEVATRMVSARSPRPRRRAKQAARKRAPKSLNAAVGPWNSSSTESLLCPGRATSGAGKLNASEASGANSGASGSPATNGASSRTATLARSSAPSNCGGASRGQPTGTYSPPSGARPWRTAALKPAAGAWPRELTKSAVDVIALTRSAARPMIALRRPTHRWPARAARTRFASRRAPRQRSPRAPRRTSRARRPSLHGAAAHVRKARNERLALRLDHHVLEGSADHVQIVGVAAGDEPGEVGRLPHEVRHLHAGPEDGARLAGGQEHVRVDDHGADPGRHRDVLHARVIDADGEHQPAVQRGGDVVHVTRTARHRLSGHGELQQLEWAACLRQQRIRRHHGADRRGRRAPQTRAERNPLVDLQREPEPRAPRLLHRQQRAPGGVVARLPGQLPGDAAHRVDGHSRCGAPPHRHAIPERIHRKSQDVEADGDVAHRGRCERRRARERRRTHSRAPR